MKVLMFGWEFPPHISGGLGTACYGMVRGLANNDVDVLFVMPSASGDEDGRVARIINASDVEATDIKCSPMDFLERINFLRIGSNLVPYVDPQDFTEMVEEDRHSQAREFKINFKQKYKFSGKYGTNLMEEVARYALVGGTIALQNDFDIIQG